VAEHGRTPRPSGHASDGQHFLRSATLATELIEQIGVSRHDLVVEIGAGTGALTRPLLANAGRVVAIELDEAFAAHLRASMGGDPRLRVVCANALRAPLPVEPFRVVGNLPFGSGTRILQRLLDDPATALVRADVLIQFEAARKRALAAPSALATLRWAPWWSFRLLRRVHRTAFDPPPSVDAGLLSIERRTAPLLPPDDRRVYLRTLATGFARTDRPLRHALRVPSRAWVAFVAARGLPRDARANDLDVRDWIALQGLVRPQR
jgi:23S rRNA (adenine-N6)-dimethyltransferase